MLLDGRQQHRDHHLQPLAARPIDASHSAIMRPVRGQLRNNRAERIKVSIV